MPKAKFNYFDAFERIAEHACKEAKMLNDILNNYSPNDLAEQIVKLHEIENAADMENHEIYRHLAHEFVTPIEREDIVTLANHADLQGQRLAEPFLGDREGIAEPDNPVEIRHAVINCPPPHGQGHGPPAARVLRQKCLLFLGVDVGDGELERATVICHVRLVTLLRYPRLVRDGEKTV